MLSPRCQPVQRGSLCKLPSSSPLSSWFIIPAKQPGPNVPGIVRARISHEKPEVTDGRERRRSVKDVWRPKRNGEHEAAESTSYGSEAAHKDWLRQQLTYLSTCNGLSLANVSDTTGFHKDSEKSFTKRPSHRGKDLWLAKNRNGSIETGAKVDVWMAEKHITASPPPSMSLGSMRLAKEQLIDELASSQESRKRRDVWRGRSNEDGLKTNLNHSGSSRKRLYLVDIHALCYDGSKVEPTKVVEWLKLLFTEVSQDNPIIAVMDGERGNEYRRKLLPSYKAKRNYYKPLAAGNGHSSPANDLRKALPLIQGFLTLCHIPVVKLEFAEADDVIASLASQARHEGFQVVIASPDMDFKQLLSPDVHMLLPLPELGRWSFYTLQNYVLQNTVTPDLELGLKCMLGDVSDNVIGLSDVAPGFGRKTALKLMQKHGSLEKLLAAAATRTVGRDYIQDALTKHADLLRRNLQVLSLRTDVDVVLEEQWCRPRCLSNDVLALELLNERLRSG